MKKLWFKRKIYGWGWYPATWEGWVVILVYMGAVFAFAATIDEQSPPRELVFTFFLPITFLTIALLRICYATGEKPRWQWGNKDKQ
ncbi:MAG: hypothetical protein KBD29_02490 [Candidatus Magasanikbacteria bacterium]|nr:hypothetical protein [Candidatus Magasanikbacteria bacterium]